MGATEAKTSSLRSPSAAVLRLRRPAGEGPPPCLLDHVALASPWFHYIFETTKMQVRLPGKAHQRSRSNPAQVEKSSRHHREEY